MIAATLFKLAAQSAWNRRSSVLLLLLSVLTSTVLLLGIDMARQSARISFSNAVSGVDLIVGAQNSPVALLMYSVFRMGEAAQNMPIEAFQSIQNNPMVASAIPISLGDTYQGFSVLGTSSLYFSDFRYGEKQALRFVEGKSFQDYKPGMPVAVLFDAVLGAEVARSLGHKLGDAIALSHGTTLGGAALEHADKPFRVAGILAPTGTPVDRSVHISLQGMEAIHIDWQAGVPVPGMRIPADYVSKFDLQPKSVTAALVSLKSRAMVFRVQRSLQNDRDFALTALLPGVALSTLWQTVGMVERLLLLIAGLVALVSALGLISVMLVALSQRRRELAVLRSIGAGPRALLVLLCLESTFVMVLGVAAGVGLTAFLAAMLSPWLQSGFGLTLVSVWDLQTGLSCVGAFAVLGSVLGLVPGVQAYRQQLRDGLTPRV